MASTREPALATQQPHDYTLRFVSAPLTDSQHTHGSLKRKLKRFARRSLLKEYSIQHTQSPQSVKKKTPTRPMMRMKDSDDYITARAANPRTGMISPSIAGTPGSPSPALRHRNTSPSGSPTPDISARPALRRANEVRKVSAGSVQQRWRTDDKGWFNDDLLALSAASPRTSDASVGAADLVHRASSACGATGDRFVVNMPSAREPQPYAYPGRSAKEIEAFEHYRRKARKVSGEGWDQRCVQSNGGAVRAEVRQRRKVSGSQDTHTYTTALKHGLAGAELLHSMGVEDYNPASFAPYCSPKTPARRTSGPHRDSKPAQAFAAPIPRKPVSSKLRQGPDTEDVDNALIVTHLSQLPKVNLRHPELASLPVAKLRSQPQRVALPTSERVCSLGCKSSGGACSNRTLERSTKHSHVVPLFADVEPYSDEEHETWPLDILRLVSSTYASLQPLVGTTVETLAQLSFRIRLPWPALVRTLTAAEASPEQKVAAMRELLAASAQVLTALVVVSLVWKLVSAVGHVFGILLWPALVPLKVVRWVVLRY